MEQAPNRRGRPALDAARRAREADTERLVNRARQLGVLLGVVQFGLFTDYPPLTRELGLLFAVGYGVTAWWSGRVLATDPSLGELRRLTTLTLGIDTALLASTAIVLAYQDDPTNLLFMVLPLLEAAMKRQLRGALWLSGVAALVEVARVLVRANVHELPVEPAESTFFAGMMLLIALFAGGLVRLQVQSQDQLAIVNDRLSTTRRLLRSGLASFSGAVGLQDLLHEAVDGLGLEAAVVQPDDGPAVASPVQAATDPAVGTLAARLRLEQPEDGILIEHQRGDDDGFWVAIALDARSPSSGSLVARVTSADGVDDARALQAELSALMRAATALAVEEEMREASSQLEKLRSDFIAVTSHEIRTPITIIRGALELLDSPAGTHRHDELVATAARHTARLCAVLDNLRVVQRLDEGGLGVQHDHIPIEDVITSAITEVAGADRGSVEVGLSPSLAAWGDADLLQTVLRCLIDNALTHGKARDVRIAAAREGGWVVVDVSDDGPGVPEQARARIFERFATANAMHHRIGAGIGLPLARELARLMDGDVSLLDDGRTTFRVVVPAGPATVH